MIGKQLHVTPIEALTSEAFITPYNSEKMPYIKKPARGTGLWTSTWREETQDSAWIEWCCGNGFGEPYKENWHILTPPENTKLFVVDSMMDFHRLLRYYGYEDEKMKSYGMHRTHIDFERMIQEYDGIWLTEQGNTETHLSDPDDLNYWDCESILWFKWCFTSVERIETPQPVMTVEM